jgi:alanyl-tRNA synthetase
MGDTGPCGPCSEIFYDHGDKIFGGLPGTKDADGDRYVEIWNLVFMQYLQKSDGKKVKLPNPSIDTGMGLERINAVIENVSDNYDTKLFRKLIGISEELSKVKITPQNIASHRIIADHLRAASFLIADGVMPANEGRGYVLRRIMRRAMRHVHQLGVRTPLMHKMLPYLVTEMANAYPELTNASSLISQILQQEEEKFGLTLSNGLKLLDTELSSLSNSKVFSGQVAFKLYDTYGFPLDLTKDIVEKRNIKLDEEEFASCMQKQKELARKSWAGSGEKVTEELWFELYNSFGATEFVGYHQNSARACVLALIVDGKKTSTAKVGQQVMILVNQTPFYAESGGQMGDIGFIYAEKNLKIKITDTKKYMQNLHVHIGIVVDGSIAVNEEVRLEIDEDYRNKLRANHSATHLLHYVLRKNLGEHVVQKGSLVTAEKLRFDFTHPKALSKGEVITIEEQVNALICSNNETKTVIMPQDQAKAMGAMALFGEKYQEEVRVVSMGNNLNASIELCGGTHVKASGDIGLLKIVSEGAISSGVRRVEAITGLAALQTIRAQQTQVEELCSLVKANQIDLLEKIKALLQEKKDLEKKINQLKQASLNEADLSELALINGVNFISQVSQKLEAKDLKLLAQNLQKKHHSCIVLVASMVDEKVLVLILVSQDLTIKYKAHELIKPFMAIVGGNGGGKEQMAQGQGSNVVQIPKAIKAVQDYLTQAHE